MQPKTQEELIFAMLFGGSADDRAKAANDLASQLLNDGIDSLMDKLAARVAQTDYSSLIDLDRLAALLKTKVSEELMRHE